MTGQGNGQGGREHGQKADQLPGYRRIDDTAAREHIAGDLGHRPRGACPAPGRSAYEMLDGAGHGRRRPGAASSSGSNPAVSAPSGRHVAERLRALDLLVVSDFFLSETARLADVVLPAAQWAEEDGTMTNLEGRVVRRRKALATPPGRAHRPRDHGRPRRSARASGAAFAYEDAARGLRRAAAGHRRRHRRLLGHHLRAHRPGERRLLAVPRQKGTRARPGSSATASPRRAGRARFHAVEHEGPSEAPDAEYPAVPHDRARAGPLSVGHPDPAGGRARGASAEDAIAEIHPLLARQHGLGDGDPVRLRTRRGEAVFRVKLAREIRPDTVFVPFHWAGTQSANRLTNPALDPVSRMPEFKVCAVRIESATAEAATAMEEI